MSLASVIGGMTTGMQGWWRLNDATGAATAADSSGNNRPLTRQNLASAPGLLLDGSGDLATVFNGTSSQAKTPHAAWMEGTTITGFLLFKVTSAADYFSVACVDSDANGYGGHLAWRVRTEIDKVSFLWDSAGLGDDPEPSPLPAEPRAITTLSTPASTIVAGQTYSLAFVHTGSNARIYLNGVLSAEKTGANPIKSPTTGAFRLGAVDDAAFGAFPGTMDEVAYWSRALSAAEISALHTAATSPPPPAPGVPTAVAVDTITATSARLHWAAPSTGGPPSDYDVRITPT